MRDSRLFGSVMMILGTCIGAGMLALPVVTAQENFFAIAITMLACWFLSTLGAFALMSMTLALKPGQNIISITESQLGVPGRLFAWVGYIAMLYSLIAAYLAATSEIIENIVVGSHITLSYATATTLSLVIFSAVLSRGIHFVDMTNRLLMLAKGVTYIIILAILMQKVNWPQLSVGLNSASSSTYMIVLTAFGYSVIVPSICEYLARDVKKIITAIVLGSALPMLIYLAWIALFKSTLPSAGIDSLSAIAHHEHANDALLLTIGHHFQSQWLVQLVRSFMSIAVTTSFLGVALALSDILSDGMHIEKKGKGALIVYAMTFIPPYCIVLFKPTLFTTALNYAGVCSFFLLIFMPVLLCVLYKLRKHHASAL